MAATGYQDNIGNILGTNTANNLYNSDTVVANANGSMVERQEFIQDAVADVQTRADEVTVKLTAFADTTTVPNNSQAAAGLLGTATAGAIMIEDIVVQRGATNAAGPTNYRFSTDNVNGPTGKASPFGTMLLATWNAQLISTLVIDGTIKQLPYILESGKKLYVDGDDAATTGAVKTDVYIKYKPVVAGASLA